MCPACPSLGVDVYVHRQLVHVEEEVEEGEQESEEGKHLEPTTAAASIVAAVSA
ncbi:hypothetical protein E2C01_092154 [Portunus trituberculatus]|uniref:Uncharacterized protein n=1 Tax=Portunus trituberculatus TaxID=210409 RepID=A0A5B7JX06_PORTR|nr:hypothetical protein [Portunus trituberculatus]